MGKFAAFFACRSVIFFADFFPFAFFACVAEGVRGACELGALACVRTCAWARSAAVLSRHLIHLLREPK